MQGVNPYVSRSAANQTFTWLYTTCQNKNYLRASIFDDRYSVYIYIYAIADLSFINCKFEGWSRSTSDWVQIATLIWKWKVHWRSSETTSGEKGWSCPVIRDKYHVWLGVYIVLLGDQDNAQCLARPSVVVSLTRMWPVSTRNSATSSTAVWILWFPHSSSWPQCSASSLTVDIIDWAQHILTQQLGSRGVVSNNPSKSRIWKNCWMILSSWVHFGISTEFCTGVKYRETSLKDANMNCCEWNSIKLREIDRT